MERHTFSVSSVIGICGGSLSLDAGERFVAVLDFFLLLLLLLLMLLLLLRTGYTPDG